MSEPNINLDNFVRSLLSLDRVTARKILEITCLWTLATYNSISRAYPIRPPASTMLRTKSGSGVAW